MILSQNLQQLLSSEYQNEIYNHICYKYLETIAASQALDGIEEYFHDEAHGEHEHSKMIVKYMKDRGCTLLPPVTIKQVTAYGMEWEDNFNQALKLEEDTTALINQIYEQADIENDTFTMEWLLKKNGLIHIQKHEEKEAQQVIDRFKIADNLHLFDIWIDEEING